MAESDIDHGLSLWDVIPQRSCELGGRRIMMVSPGSWRGTIVPRFHLYKRGAIHPHESERFLVQPAIDTMRRISGSLVFYTPAQPQTNLILDSGFEVRLGLYRYEDRLMGPTVPFSLIPHSHRGNWCVLCYSFPDSHVPVNPVPGVRLGPESSSIVRDPERDNDRPLDLTVSNRQAVLLAPRKVRRTKGQIAQGSVGFECSFCKLILSRQQTLRAHMQKFHPTWLGSSRVAQADITSVGLDQGFSLPGSPADCDPR
jgi:hypothetical protein